MMLETVAKLTAGRYVRKYRRQNVDIPLLRLLSSHLCFR